MIALEENKNEREREGMDILYAIRRGDLERVREYVTAENVNAQIDGVAAPAISIACRNKHDHLVSYFIGLGANVNARDNAMWTPLHDAVNYSATRCVDLLLDAGADASITTSTGLIPLQVAFDSVECATRLIAAYPGGIHAVDIYGSTTLHSTCRCSGNLEVARLLLDAGSDVNAMDNEGRTPLYWAIYTNRRELGELLLDRGARLDLIKSLPIPEWATAFVALRQACRSSCYAMLELSRRRSSVIGGNRRDALGLIARMMWNTRQNEAWEKKIHKGGRK